MLYQPAEIEITRQDGRQEILDIVPIYRTEGEAYLTTGAVQIFAALLEHEEEGTHHPGFLGELHFHGQTAYEWQYIGDRLTEAEVLQIVDRLRTHQLLFLVGNDADSALSFTYHQSNGNRYIQIVPDEDRFIVFINGRDTTKVEPIANGWAITTTDTLSKDLENELIKRIQAHKA